MAISLDSFVASMRVVLIGATGGIGQAIADRLGSHPRVGKLYTFARQPDAPGCQPLYLEDKSTIETAARRVGEAAPPDLVVVATGLLHDGTALMPEKSLKVLDADSLARLYRVNAIGPALIAKHFLPLMTSRRKAVFAALGARVGRIADNHLGGWYGYRMSKAALAMLVRTLAVETARRNPGAVCLALHPCTVDTDLSKPFQKAVSDDTLVAPEIAASNLLNVIDTVNPQQSGQHLAWDGSRVPF